MSGMGSHCVGMGSELFQFHVFNETFHQAINELIELLNFYQTSKIVKNDFVLE